MGVPYLFTVKNHDLHHRDLEVNYGQYIMLWDWVFGSYREFGETSPLQKPKAKAKAL